jgi:putative ABC transport system permease protein
VRGPLVVDEAAAERLGVDWTARWRAAPALADVGAGLLAPLSSSVAGLRGAVAALPSGGGPSPGAETGMADLLAGLVPPVRAASGAVRTLLVLLTAVAAGLCLLVGSTVAAVRQADDAVLRARGGGSRTRLLLGLREGAAWAALAAVPAAALAPVAVLVTGRGSVAAPSPLAAVVAALVCTAGVALLLVAVTALAGRAAGAGGAGRPGEGLPVRPPTLLVVAVTAVAAGWQLRSGAGVPPDDPVLVVAVAVLLASASVIVVVALAVLARPAGSAGSRAGPVFALAGWHAGRRGLQPVSAVAVVVLCAAGAVCLLAARDAGREAATDRAHQEVAPLAAVAFPVAPGTPVEAGADRGAQVTGRLAALPGVAAVSPVVSLDGSVGSSGPVRVLAVDKGLLARLTADAPPAEVPAAAAALLGNTSGDPRSLSVSALLTRSFAGQLGVSGGQEVAVEDTTGRRLTLVVAGLVDGLPADPFRADGTPVAVVDLADLARAEAAVPPPPPPPQGQPRPRWPLPPRAVRQWWVLPASGTDAAAVAARALEVARGTPGGATSTGAAPVAVTRAQAEQRLLDEPVTSGLGRLDLVGAAALTLAGFGALLLGQLASTRRRRGELAVLRAVGLSTAQARRLALAEALLVGGLAVLAGVLLGAGLAPWSTGQLAGLPASGAVGAVRPGVVLVVSGVLAAGVLVVAAVRARAAVTAQVPSVVREQVT